MDGKGLSVFTGYWWSPEPAWMLWMPFQLPRDPSLGCRSPSFQVQITEDEDLILLTAMTLWTSITKKSKTQLTVVPWDQFIITCWLLFAVNQISLKTEWILFHEPQRAQWKQQPELIPPVPNHTRQILNQASPEVSWSPDLKFCPFCNQRELLDLLQWCQSCFLPRILFMGGF